MEPGEAASSPHRGPRVNTQMMTSLPSPSTPSSLPLIDSLCSQSLPRKGYQFTFQALRVLTRVLILLPLVKVFSFLFVIFWFHCILTFNCMLSCICMLTWKSLSNRDGLGRIQCLCRSSADVPKWGLYGVAEQKGVWRTVLYNGFRFVLGYRNWPTLNTQWRRLS